MVNSLMLPTLVLTLITTAILMLGLVSAMVHSNLSGISSIMGTPNLSNRLTPIYS